MKAFDRLTLILTVTMFALSASAQTINSNQGKSWPANGSTAQSDNSDLELSAEELETLEDADITKTTSSSEASTTSSSSNEKSSTETKAATTENTDNKVAGEVISAEDIEDDADIADIDKDLKEIDDLLAVDSDETEYEILETRIIDGKPVTQAKRVSKSELQSIVTKRKTLVDAPATTTTVISTGVPATTNKSAITTTKTKTSSKVVKRGKPRRRVVRRVLRTRSAPKSAASSQQQSSKTSTTVVKTRTPVVKKKDNKRLHIMPVVGASYGRIEGDHLTNRFQNSLESDFGLTSGALIEYRNSDSLFGFELGVMYNQTTVTGDQSNAQNQTASLDYMMNEYLMFPISVKVYPVRMENFNAYALAGVAPGVLIDSNFQQTQSGILSTSGSSAALFKDGEFQWHAGLGAKFRINTDLSIGVEGKFYRSFSDITDSSSNTLGGEAYNVGWSTYAGLVVHL